MNKDLSKNINLYYLFHASRASLFFVAIWVVFQETYLTYDQIAYFGALSWFIMVIFELPTRVLADLISRKYSTTVGSFIAGLSFITFLYPSHPQMYIYVFLFGLGTSMISGSTKALIFDTLKELKREDDYPTIMANASFIFQTTSLIAILLGGYLYTFNKSLPYVLRGIVLIIGAIVPLFMIEPHIDTYKFNFKNYIIQTKLGFLEAFKSKYISLLSLLFILVAGISLANHRFFSIKFMMEIGINDIQRAWLVAIIKLAVAITTIILTKNKKLFHNKWFLLFLPTVMTLTLIPIKYLSAPLVFFFLFGIALPSSTRNIFIEYHLNKSFASKYRATALSSLNLLVSLLYSLTVCLGGKFVTDNTVGEYYFFIGIFFLIGVIPLTLLVTKIKR